MNEAKRQPEYWWFPLNAEGARIEADWFCIRDAVASLREAICAAKSSNSEYVDDGHPLVDKG